MNASMNWLLPSTEHEMLFTAVLLLAKVTVLLAGVWCVHILLCRANPRWRVLLWRSTAVGMLLLIALTACPPLVSWGVLPPEVAPSEPLASRSFGPSIQPTEQTAPRVVPETSAAPALVGDQLPPSPSWRKDPVAREKSRSQQPLATSKFARTEPSPVAMEIAQTPPIAWNQSTVILGAIGVLWLAGLVCLASWTLIGLRRLRAIVRRSQPAPDWVSEQADRVKDTLGCKRSFVLRTTGEVATPCLVGIRRPVILLPEGQVDPARSEELPAILLHETAHLKAGDLPWNAVLHALSILFWPHPLVWKIRLAHASACETVADAVAADHVGDVTHYIRTLARLAVQMRSPALGTALAMAGTSSVMQRIEALQRKLFLARLPRGRMFLAVGLSAIVVGLMGGVALTRATAEPQAAATVAEATPPSAESDSKMDQLVVYATDADTGKPLAGVEFHFRGSIDEQKIEHVKQTDDQGHASISWEAGATIDYMRATWSKKGFVSQHYSWLPPLVYMFGNDQPVELPEELHLKFHRGQTLGGFVQDEEGRPIEGATVQVSMDIDGPEERPGWFLATDRTSDAEGRWQWDEAPEDLGRVTIHVNCPGYLNGESSTSKCVLKRGESVTGRVVDADGEPIDGAAVRLGKDRRSNSGETQTDADGRFVLENCRPADSVVTVQAEGYSPQLRDIVVGTQEDAGEFRLERGHTIRIRVVDRNGEPIQDVSCRADRWHDCRSLKLNLTTDAEGRARWQSAPEDTIIWEIVKSGYMTDRDKALEASDEEHVITLHSHLVTSGRVTDAATGEPIPAFEMTPGILYAGRLQPTWTEQASLAFQDGSYRYRFLDPIRGQYILKFSAPGYTPLESRPIDMDEGAVTLDLALKSDQERSVPSMAKLRLGKTTEEAKAETKQRRLVVRATAKDTQRSLTGVKIHFQGRLNGTRFEQHLETDAEGTASLEWDADVRFGRLFMTCLKSSFIPIRYLWGDQGKPEAPEEVHLQFVTGKWIGGVVQDPDGRPIEGATVKLQTIVDLPKPAYYWGNVAELTTDAEGRWRWQGVPSDLGVYDIEIEHPDYTGRNLLRPSTDATYVMRPGGRLSGRVLATDGKPIARASVLLGHLHNAGGAPKANTDAEGRFVFENCEPGETLVTVQAHRHSPQWRKVVVGEQEELVDFRLAPGHTIRVRVVDMQGAPIKGAFVDVQSWQGLETINFSDHTDDEGRVSWTYAPEDTVLFDIGAVGCAELKRHPLQASDEEHVVTLSSELIVRGTVKDAKTGQPISPFIIQPGFDQGPSGMGWIRDLEDRHEDGAYQWNPRARLDGAHRLRVEAPGYHTKMSRVFEMNEGSVTFDFSLEPGTDMVGTVLDADGNPVSDARVGLAKAGSRAGLSDGHFYRHQNYAEVVATDESGKFVFPPQGDEPFLLIVIHDLGFAKATQEQFEKSSQIKLEPWGRVEGQVFLGDKPDANRMVEFRPQLEDQPTFVLRCNCWATTDAQGRFQIERVVPGSGSLCRMITTEHYTPGWQQAIDVASNETAMVTIGGTGRPVTGRFELDREPDMAIDWKTNLSVTIHRWDTNNDQADEERFECHGKIDGTGRFEVPDVPPGDYRLVRHVRGVTPPTKIGKVEHNFTVPPLAGKRSDVPLDLGAITVKVVTETE